jgi:hypothetical protein
MKGVQNSSVLTVRELPASLNPEGRAKSYVHYELLIELLTACKPASII